MADVSSKDPIPPAGEGVDTYISVRLSMEARKAFRLLTGLSDQTYEELLTEWIRNDIRERKLSPLLRKSLKAN